MSFRWVRLSWSVGDSAALRCWITYRKFSRAKTFSCTTDVTLGLVSRTPGSLQKLCFFVSFWEEPTSG